jgi:hypothetical protein
MSDLPTAHDPPGVPICGDVSPREGCPTCAKWASDPEAPARTAAVRAQRQAFRQAYEASRRKRVLVPRRTVERVKAAASDLAKRFADAIRQRKEA